MRTWRPTMDMEKLTFPDQREQGNTWLFKKPGVSTE